MPTRGQDEPRTPAPGGELFLGTSAAAREVRRLVARAARAECTVLITGESGVGKELVARAIHQCSARRTGPFIAVNCAAIPPTLIESELFGHERGAFTDARAARRGLFELADGGTLFLDEIGEMSLEAQPKLLRVLETGDVQRVGGEASRHVDARIVSATNVDLGALTGARRFRSDLYYRINVFVVPVPPLRERVEDIPELARHFGHELARKTRRPFVDISAAAMSRLQCHDWPGNVRELRSLIERGLAMHSGPVLDVDAFEVARASHPAVEALFDRGWKAAREAFEEVFTRRLLARHGGNVREAAREAGLTPRGLYKMIRRLERREGSVEPPDRP